MRKKLTNKGFSLVELLAVIVILGILGVISVAAVNVVLNKANKNYYETQEKDLLTAAKSYSQDNRNVLPKNVGDTRVITLEELQRAKYIGKVLDRNKKECTEGTVTIFKYSQTDYSYKTYLKCTKWVTGGNEDDPGEDDSDGPAISLSINADYKNPSFTYKITASGDAKIISYSYEIYKYDLLIKDSGSIPVSKASSIGNKTVSLKEFVPGEFKVVVNATDIYGKTNAVNKKATIEMENGPQCGVVEPNLSTWVNIPSVTINVSCIDRTGAGCAKEVFSQIFTTEAKTNFLEISDNLGNKTSCRVNTYIDRTPPSKPVITNSYENTWINKDYSIQVSSKDKTSGIKYFEYRFPSSANPSERNWTQYAGSSKGPNDSSKFTTPKFTTNRNEVIEIRACDLAGNCSEVARSTIKIDKTKPTCSVSRNIASPNGQNGWYVSHVGLTLNENDTGGSGVNARDLTTSSSATYAGKSTATQRDTTGVTYYGYVRDAAGNTNTCNSGSFKVDATAPTCSITRSIASPNGQNGWYVSNVGLTLRPNDTGGSNLSAKDMTTSAAASYNGRTTATQTETSGVTYHGYVKDNAGNVGSCNSGLIKVDTTRPTCSVRVTGTNPSSGVYVLNAALALSANNPGAAGSALSYGLSSNASTTYNGWATANQGPTTGATWYGFVKDAAGHTNSCNSGWFKVIANPPVISFSLSGSTSTAVCRDGTTGAEIGRWTMHVGNSTHTVTCTDVYGQRRTCSQNYYSSESCDSCYSCACTGCCGTCKSGWCYCCCGDCDTCCSTDIGKSGGMYCS